MTNLATALVLVLHTVLSQTSQDRLRVVTDDMVAVVNEEISNGGLKSTIKSREALAMLAAAVTYESGFREAVEKCRVNGDGGRSIGLGQVMIGQNWEGHSRKEICSDRKLQLKLALHVIDRCWQRTPKADSSFRCYTSGDAAKDSHTAKKELSIYRKLKAAIDLHDASQVKDKEVPKNSDKDVKGEVLAKNP